MEEYNNKHILLPNFNQEKSPKNATSTATSTCKNERNVKSLQSISFFNFIYQSLYKLSDGKIDMFSLNQLTDLPLIICDKLIKIMTSHKKKQVTQDEFSFVLDQLYFGSDFEKAKLIGMLCDFKRNEYITIGDMKLLLLHFHMRLLSDETENEIVSIIKKFFNGKEYMSFIDFISQCFEYSYDVVNIFNCYFEKFKFFNTTQLQYFQEVQKKLMYKNKKKKNKDNAFSTNINTFNNSVTNSTLVSTHQNVAMRLNQTVFTGTISDMGIMNSQNDAKSLYYVPTTYDNYDTKEQHVSENAKKYIDKVNKVDLHAQYMKCEEVTVDDEDLEMQSLFDNFNNDYQNITKHFKSMVEYSEHIVLKKFPHKKKEDNENDNNFNLSPRSCDNTANETARKDIKMFFYTKKKDSVLIGRKLDSYYDSYTNERIIYMFDQNVTNAQKENTEPKIKRTIICYKLNKTCNKFKRIKLEIVDNMIFYFNSTNHHSKSFTFKKLLLFSQLYPNLIKTPFIPDSVSFPLPQNYQPKGPIVVHQIQIISNIHNNLIYIDLFSLNEDDLIFLYNTITDFQHIKKIEDYYDIGEELGHGRFGKVMLVEKKCTKEKLTVKKVEKCEKEHSEENFKCCQWEKDIFRFLINVHNKNIERCYEFYETPTVLFYINEYIEGGDLKNLIQTNKKKDVPIVNNVKSIDLLNSLSRQLIKGIYCLHQYGIIHRDIKHTNTLVSVSNKKKIELKIIDFGLSKVMGYDEYANEHYGSLSFKAPELVAAQKYSFNVDVWAVGITIFFMIYNTYPIKADNKHLLKKKIMYFTFDPSQHMTFGNCDDYMNRIMQKCLTKDPRKRPNSSNLVKVTLNYDDY